MSFVPDGTNVEGQSSQLFKTLDSELGAGRWEATILKALQTWAMNSNINLGVVSDDGEPLGTAGPAQGDARFGDIRIGAEPLPAGVVAITSPYNPATGTLSGDMILNSSYDFNPADQGSYDPFTVALHEAGHVFGFADSSDPSSFMYDVYQGPQSGLAPGAVSAIQSLYGGPRAINAIDGNAISQDPSAPVALASPLSTTSPVIAAGDLATPQDSDYLTFQSPGLLAAPLGVTINVQTSGLSLLAPKITVRDPFGNVVATASASGPLDGGASAHVLGLLPGVKYSIQVSGATGDVFSVGSYQLSIAPTISLPGLLSGLLTNPTAGAVPIAESANYAGATPLTVSDSITQASQTDVYSFRTPAVMPYGMTVNLQDWGVGLTAPSISVYSVLNLLVGTATAPGAANPSVSLPVGLLLPNTTYSLKVTNGTTLPNLVGTYLASVSFSSPSAASSTAFTPATPWFGAPSTGPAASNTTLATAATLQTPIGDAPASHYEAIEGVSPSAAQQYFQFTAPPATAGQPLVMMVSVQTLDSGTMQPWIGVFDQSGQPLNAQVLTAEGGVEVVQVALPNPGSTYYLSVAAAQSGGTQTSGNFFLNTTFGANQAMIGPISSGTLSASPAGSPTPAASASLAVPSAGLYSFVLDGSPTNVGTDAILQMTVLDPSGNVVTTLSTPAALAASTIVTLPAGSYTIRIGAYSPTGKPIPALAYSLTGTNLTDPIKVIATSGSGGATPAR